MKKKNPKGLAKKSLIYSVSKYQEWYGRFNNSFTIPMKDIQAAQKHLEEEEIPNGQELCIYGNGNRIKLQGDTIKVSPCKTPHFLIDGGYIKPSHKIVIKGMFLNAQQTKVSPALSYLKNAKNLVYLNDENGASNSVSKDMCCFRRGSYPYFYYAVKTGDVSKALNFLNFSENDTVIKCFIDGGELSCMEVLKDGVIRPEANSYEKEEFVKYHNIPLYNEKSPESQARIGKALESFHEYKGSPVKDSKAFIKKVHDYLQGIIDSHVDDILFDIANNYSDKPVQTADEAREIISKHNVTESGTADELGFAVLFQDSDIIVAANTAFNNSTSKPLSHQYGGPNLDFPIEAINIAVMRQLFQAFQKVLFKEGCEVRLMFSFINQIG